MNVIVLDGNENQAVACVRSLARAGHDVVVGSADRWSKSGWSRFSKQSFRYPDPRDHLHRFVDALVVESAKYPGALILPVTERTTLPVSWQRARLIEAGARLVLPSHEIVCRAFDKDETTRLAAKLGVATPQTSLLTCHDDARAAAERLAYPLVLKPRASEELIGGQRVRATGAPIYVSQAAQLPAAFSEIHRRASAALAQEYVEGTGVGYFALMRHGEMRLEFAHRRIRDVRPTGSGSAVRESAPIDPAMRDGALKILGALKWHGPAMVEFRVRTDGTPVFMEVNGRFWHSLALAVAAGCDFPACTAALARDGDITAQTAYRVGVRCRWLLGDARHLIAVLHGPPDNFSGEFPRRWQTVVDVLRPVRGTFHDNFSWDDPLPELGDWLDFLTRRVGGALRRRNRPAS